MTLLEFIESLNERKQYDLALEFCDRTLAIWNEYANSHALEYTDTVVGTKHTVKSDILTRALMVVKNELDVPKSQTHEIVLIRQELSDPIVALQDLDWELPKPVEMSFYAIRNLIDRIDGQETTVFNEPQLFVVVNQAIEALMLINAINETEISEIFEKYAVK
tara:strand:+ start:10256 stop:10744 length:489 start_codon:yes stop_codon:yes gene_type:complete